MCSVSRRLGAVLWLRDDEVDYWFYGRDCRPTVQRPGVQSTHTRRVYRLIQLLAAQMCSTGLMTDQQVASPRAGRTRRCEGNCDARRVTVLNGYTWPDEGTPTEESRSGGRPASHGRSPSVARFVLQDQYASRATIDSRQKGQRAVS